MEEIERAAQLAQALADPLRLQLLQRLMAGPAAVADLTASSGASQSNVSNHLALLRAQRLVKNERRGRQMVYEIRDAGVARLIEALSTVAGDVPKLSRREAPIAVSRTCYDHLAGKLGVRLFDGLVEAEAIRPPAIAGGPVELGPAAMPVLDRLGVDLTRIPRGRRKFAYACLDWTERRFHLGGALGAAVCDQLTSAGWVERQPGTRAVQLTPAGTAALRDRLGVTIDGVGAG